jgi:hypothetical protein
MKKKNTNCPCLYTSGFQRIFREMPSGIWETLRNKYLRVEKRTNHSKNKPSDVSDIQ